MAGNKLTIALTSDQQKKIQDATGQSIAELNIDLAPNGNLSDGELDRVSGGVTEACCNGQHIPTVSL